MSDSPERVILNHVESKGILADGYTFRWAKDIQDAVAELVAERDLYKRAANLEIWVSTDSEGYTDGFYTTLEIGIETIKRLFPKPYDVDWYEQEVGDETQLIGHFEYVYAYSVQHTAIWNLRPVKVVGAVKIPG